MAKKKLKLKLKPTRMKTSEPEPAPTKPAKTPSPTPKPVAAAPPPPPKRRRIPMGRPVHTPAGTCPVRLQGHDDGAVESWINLLLSKGEQEGVRYQREAVRYFVRQFYEMRSPEFLQVCEIIDGCFAN